MLRLIRVYTGGTCYFVSLFVHSYQVQLISKLFNILLNQQNMSMESAICLPITQTLYHISINFNMSALYYF